MIIKESHLAVADNSGAKEVKLIKVLGGAGRETAHVGDVIVVSIKAAVPGGKVKKGDVKKAIVIRTKASVRRDDGTKINFSDNAVVLLNDQGELIATRISGCVPREIKEKNAKITSLAVEVI